MYPRFFVRKICKIGFCPTARFGSLDFCKIVVLRYKWNDERMMINENDMKVGERGL